MAKRKEEGGSVAESTEQSPSSMIALKDFHIVQNEHDIVIKAGDDLSGIPETFIPNLKTEGVLA